MYKQNVLYLKKLILIWKGWNTAPLPSSYTGVSSSYKISRNVRLQSL